MSSSVSSTPPEVPYCELLMTTSSREPLLVLPLHLHRVDRQLAPVVSFENDDLKQVCGTVWAQIEDSPRGFVFVGFALVEAVIHGMANVSVRDAVLPRRPVYLHGMRISYYETPVRPCAVGHGRASG